MDRDNCDSQATGKKLSDQFVEFIDLTDEDLEEVDVLELGDIHGGECGCGGNCGCGGDCGGDCGCGRRRRRRRRFFCFCGHRRRHCGCGGDCGGDCGGCGD